MRWKGTAPGTDPCNMRHCKDCDSLCEANEMRGGRCEYCYKIEEANGWDEYQQHCSMAQARLDVWQENL